MVRDAAYDSLLRSRRRSLHARIAEVIEQQFSEVAEQQPDFIAHHCIEANLTTKAVSYLCAAGRRSASRSETIEAMRQLQKGLTLIPYLPDTAERWRLELELQSLLGAVWFATRGPAAPETGQAYDRAKQLCEQLGDDKALVPVLSGQSTYHLCRCELAPMKRIGEDLLRLGTEKDHAVSRMVGHSTLGFCLTYLSEFANAIDQFERALALYDPVAHPALHPLRPSTFEQHLWPTCPGALCFGDILTKPCPAAIRRLTGTGSCATPTCWHLPFFTPQSASSYSALMKPL